MKNTFLFNLVLCLANSKKVDWVPVHEIWKDSRVSLDASTIKTYDAKFIDYSSRLFDSADTISKSDFLEHINTPDDFYFSKIEANLKPLWKIITENVANDIFNENAEVTKADFPGALDTSLQTTKTALQSSKPEYSRKDAGKFFQLVMSDLELGFLAKSLVKTAGNNYIDDLFRKCDSNGNKSLDDSEQNCLLVDWFYPTLLKVNPKQTEQEPAE